jgi:uncharacterized hydrophobic protein (TIGR00341 family)
MALRLVDVTVPQEELEGIPDLLEDVRVVDVWTWESDNDTGLVRVLLDAKDAETLSDLLVGKFGSQDGFRLVLLPVEATLPKVEEPSEEETEEDGASEESEESEPQRISREELYEDLSESSELTYVYVVMVALSTVVAAVGLTRGDIAIVIGAMVIAPLLGPNVALSLAATLGDPDLARRSLKAIGVGVGTAAVLSMLLGTLLEVDPSGPEIAARTRAEIGDIALALAAGAAGSLAFTSGVSGVVVGVMVAVALLPPLVVAGLLAGAGHGTAASGALILLLTNVTCVNLAAVGTFLVQKVRPRTWWEADRAKKATRLAVATWIILLAILLALILLGEVDVSVASRRP